MQDFLNAILGQQNAPIGTFGGNTINSKQINSQASRVADMIRQATSQSMPTLGDELRRQPAQDEAFYQNLASISMGSAPSQNIYDAGQTAIDTARKQRAEIAATQLGAEQDVYNLMMKAKEMGDQDAIAIDKTIESIVGNDPVKKKALYDEIEKDPEDINALNIAIKANKAAADLGLYNEFDRTDMDYKKAMAQAALARQGIEDKAPKGYRFKDDGTLEPIPGGEADQNAQKKQEVKDTIARVTQRLLQNESGVRANRGSISTLFPNVSNKSVDAASDLDTLKSLLTTENLGLLKGVLSDTDMKILMNIGAGGLEGSDEKVLQELREIYKKTTGQEYSGGEQQSFGDGWSIEEVQD